MVPSDRRGRKTLALGARCRNAGHRLRTRRGHCVQCDPKKLAYQARYRAEQYVYIAGSLSAKLIKIGTCVDTQQRERQLRAERYGGAADWEMIFTVWVKNAGDVEQSARSRLSHHGVARDYWKDGARQTGIELLECSFTEARRALMNAAGPCHAEYIRYSGRYEFVG
jgi:T5orf172 domain